MILVGLIIAVIVIAASVTQTQKRPKRLMFSGPPKEAWECGKSVAASIGAKLVHEDYDAGEMLGLLGASATECSLHVYFRRAERQIAVTVYVSPTTGGFDFGASRKHLLRFAEAWAVEAARRGFPAEGYYRPGVGP